MPVLSEVYHPDGTLQMSMDYRTSRIVTALTVGTSSGSAPISGVSGTLYAHFASNGGGGGTDSARNGYLTISGNSVSWHGIPPAGLPRTIIVGECGL